MPYRSPNRWIFKLLILILTLNADLTACNFPQPNQTAQPDSPQQLTEIANILNPEGLPKESTADSVEVAPTNTSPEIIPVEGYLNYTTQQGDMLSALAARFGVSMAEISAQTPLLEHGLIPIGTQLLIPDILEDVLLYNLPIIPDSEVVYSPSVQDFNVINSIQNAEGFLASYSELVKGQTLTGPEIVNLVAIETSTNPRLLLAFIEYRSNWVFGFPEDADTDSYPLDYYAGKDTGLYNELMITAKLLAQGFYGWRDGSFVELSFSKGQPQRLPPGLNAGSIAIMHLFGTLYEQPNWEERLYGEDSFLTFYQKVFGDYWARDASIDPLAYTPDEQPILNLPFSPGEAWALTGGPHSTWQTGTPWGAIDFAPITGEPACAVSYRWITAAAPGLVVRSERSVVAIDLDGDGDEGTGWVLVYQHVAEQDRVAEGTWVNQDMPIGHPSCEGGQASGTHLHFTRKLNGEWLGVGEPYPLILSGWQVFAGELRYQGYLQKDEQIINASPNGMSGSTITRGD